MDSTVEGSRLQKSAPSSLSASARFRVCRAAQIWDRAQRRRHFSKQRRVRLMALAAGQEPPAFERRPPGHLVPSVNSRLEIAAARLTALLGNTTLATSVDIRAGPP